MTDRSTARLQHRLEEFLERLGRTVESPRRGTVIARHRTALVEEETPFRIVDSGRDKPHKHAINIVAGHLPMPDGDRYPRSFRFDEFLDQTVHAGRLSREVLRDPDIFKKREAFVPQHLASEGETLQKDAVDFFFSEWLPGESSRLLAILGPAGYGKTVLTCELAHRLAADYGAAEPGKRPPFPYLVPFGQFRRLASFEGMILTSLQKKGVTDYTPGAFAQLVQENRVVLILDGFDELLEERPEEARKNLRELIETLEGRGKVVVTARSTFFRTSDEVADFLEYFLEPSQVRVIELQPFDKIQRQAFLERQLGRSKHLPRIAGFVESESLREAMGSPLLLRETVDALTAADTSTRLDQAAGRRDLFGALEQSVYARERRRHNHALSDEVQRSFLERLARELLEANVRGFDWDSTRVVALEATQEVDVPQAELDRLADHHFLTVRAESDEVQFNHQVFREYFQARALLAAVLEGTLNWILGVLAQRPAPEEVRTFLAELDKGGRLARELLETGIPGARPSERLANNLGAVVASYGNAELVKAYVGQLPKDVMIGFQLRNFDLSASDWSDRFLHGMEYIDCVLDGASFRRCRITDAAFAGGSLEGADFRGASIDSITLDYAERIFGRPEVLTALERRGAITDLREADRARDIQAERRAEIVGLVRARLNRFYIPGTSTASDSMWDSSISERNLLGGVKPGDAKFIKSKAIPRMVGMGILERRREHGNVIYQLTDKAKDASRALLERDEVTGQVGELVDRLAGKAVDDKPSRPRVTRPTADQPA